MCDAAGYLIAFALILLAWEIIRFVLGVTRDAIHRRRSEKMR